MLARRNHGVTTARHAMAPVEWRFSMPIACRAVVATACRYADMATCRHSGMPVWHGDNFPIRWHAEILPCSTNDNRSVALSLELMPTWGRRGRRSAAASQLIRRKPGRGGGSARDFAPLAPIEVAAALFRPGARQSSCH